MSLITLGDAKTDLSIRTVAGVAASSTEFPMRINGAVRQLMRRGNWWGTVQSLRACVYDGCVVWPRQVATVLAVRSCGQAVNLFNHWYEFIAWDESHRHLYQCHKRGDSIGINDGTVPVYRNIPTDGGTYLVAAYLDNMADVGKKITVYGLDGNVQVIRTTWPDQTVREGVVLSLGSIGGIYSPVVTTPTPVMRVARVMKDVTAGNVRLYAQDTSGNLTDLALYTPTETNPVYVRTRLPNPIACTCATGQIEALVKMAFIPVVNDSDLILIDNLDALRDMLQSITYKESGDIKSATAYEMSAIHELNSQMRDRFPDEQVSFNIRAFGTAEPRRAGIGRVA
jgi:hypothetical protein